MIERLTLNLKETKCNPFQIWQSFKNHLKKCLIRQSGLESKKRVQENLAEQQKSAQLRENMTHNPTATSFQMYKACQREMHDKFLANAKNRLAKHRANLLEYKHVALKVLYKILVPEKNKTIIKEMKTDKGNAVNNPQEINEHIYEFYKSLYSTQDVSGSMQDMFSNDTCDGLNAQQREAIQKQITLKELTLAVKELKKGKLPGPDGISNEFYITFF